MEKYYTPSIEEFRVNFEYQRNDGGDWFDKTCDAYDMMDVQTMLNKSNFKECNFNERVRVKYLDKEDIESLGFKYTSGKMLSSYEDNFEYGDISLIYNYKDKLIYINDFYLELINNLIIKNKSELKVLLKQLNIIDEEKNLV